MPVVLLLLISLFDSSPAIASTLASTDALNSLDLTGHWVGYLSVIIFVLAYVLVILEERIHLRKSKPVLLAAGLIWIMVALAYNANGMPLAAEHAIRIDTMHED